MKKFTPTIFGFRNVIILCATKNAQDTLPTWIQRVKNLFPPPTKVIFCENGSTDNTVRLINKCSLKAKELIQFTPEPIDTEKDNYGVIAQVRQKLLDRARELDPDYAIFLDDDVYPKQTDFISIITSYGEEIVGGQYLRIFPEGMWLGTKWHNPDYPEKSRNPWLFKKYIKNPIEEVAMTSAGCLCLSRKIIQDERINFYPIDEIRKDYSDCSEDFGYCLLAKKHGYRVYVSGQVALQHYWRQRERPWIVKKHEV